MDILTDLRKDMKKAYEAYTAYFWVAFSVGIVVAGTLGKIFGAF